MYAITLGFSNGNSFFKGLFSRLPRIFSPNAGVQTSNHLVSLTAQLNMGVRQLELHVHYLRNSLRISHCGRLQLVKLDWAVQILNTVNFAMEAGVPFVPFDGETVGCMPSLNPLPVDDQP